MERTAGQVVVLRRMADGSTRVVPLGSERPGIVESAHLACGHFDIRRTSYLLLINYWWSGIMRAAQEVVSQCEVCQRVPLSRGSCIRFLLKGCFTAGAWICAGHSRRHSGHRYVAVMIEHFSKTIVLEPLTSKEAKHTC